MGRCWDGLCVRGVCRKDEVDVGSGKQRARYHQRKSELLAERPFEYRIIVSFVLGSDVEKRAEKGSQSDKNLSPQEGCRSPKPKLNQHRTHLCFNRLD